ncbi:hypothetical protein R6258_04290 [Halomonas sp. HP20-15]|uniref:hypothetical protein n=1 Tax=Halomonas sp. HP20-15 TaxID=3085901 RepID=UPI0029821E8C|nr:hypothetical protein [Halomonas sp. HP20-15]MDW5376133.1 hypothetical protein [Halomonas sp. HP20-15]
MLKKTITWRELPDPHNVETAKYEVYDSDTGATIGMFDSREAAEEEVARMNRSDVEGLGEQQRKKDADPAAG